MPALPALSPDRLRKSAWVCASFLRRRIINPPPPYEQCVSCAQLATVIQDEGGLSPSTGIISCRAPLWNPPQSARSSKRSFPILTTCRSQKSKASCLVAAFQSTFQRVFGQVNSTRFPSCCRVIQTALNLFRAATRDENQWLIFETRVSPIPGPNDPKNHFW